MQLKNILIPDWPKLTWIAFITRGSNIINVLHGPMVETSDKWIVEGVWAGQFSKGDFDRTDLFFGTGIRLRRNKIIFVTAGSVFDRLLYFKDNDFVAVSNSLPALLVGTNSNLIEDYKHYSKDIRSMIYGLQKRVRHIPTNKGNVTSIIFNNLLFEDGKIDEKEKPDCAPHFDTFQDYLDFLIETARSLGENARSSNRQFPVIPLSSISSGYDSAVAATIARYAGCKSTVTIKKSTSFWRGSDSGKKIAGALNLKCTEYDRTSGNYPLEETIWAAEGRPGILNWTLFDYPEPLCLFFTGCHGEKMWDRVTHDHPDPFVRRDTSSFGFCEFRLIKGVFQCPVPFWGVRHSHELKAITLSKEMIPWYMNKDYDKPIARRIVEEAGVPRQAFGQVNKNTSLETPFWWPQSRNLRHSFAAYLKRHERYVPNELLLRIISILARFDHLIYLNFIKKLGYSKGKRPWNKIENYRVFQWANELLMKEYSNKLNEQGKDLLERLLQYKK